MHTTELATAPLGETGLEITRIGLSAWAIVGFRRPDQVDPLVAAASLQLSEDDLSLIQGA